MEANGLHTKHFLVIISFKNVNNLELSAIFPILHEAIKSQKSEIILPGENG